MLLPRTDAFISGRCAEVPVAPRGVQRSMTEIWNADVDSQLIIEVTNIKGGERGKMLARPCGPRLHGRRCSNYLTRHGVMHKSYAAKVNRPQRALRKRLLPTSTCPLLFPR